LKKRRNVLLGIVGILTLGWTGSERGKMILRRTACRIVGGALSLRSRRLRLHDLPRVLVVAPHPDDETFGCGGTLALLARANPSLKVIFVTDGSASHPGHALQSPEAIAAMRRDEARSAAAILGVDRSLFTFLSEPDGSLAQLGVGPIRELTGRIAGLVLDEKPSAIFLPCRNDGSSEHEAVFTIVRGAVDRTGLSPRFLEYPVWSRWNSSLLAPSIFTAKRVWRVNLGGISDVKARAMACYASQLLPIPPDSSAALPDGFASMFLGSYEFFIEN
jgi:LmbE family N-acetylglucosaminyl deacetylase